MLALALLMQAGDAEHVPEATSGRTRFSARIVYASGIFVCCN